MHDKQPTYPGRQSELDRLLAARKEETDRHLAEIGRLPPVFKVAFPGKFVPPVSERNRP